MEEASDDVSVPKQKTEAQLARQRRKAKAQREKQKEKRELAKQHDAARVGLPKRHAKVTFELPDYAPEHGLYVESAADWDSSALKPGIQVVEFGVEFNVEDSHLIDLAKASKDFRSGLRAILTHQTSASDVTLRKLTDQKAWPYLEHIRLYSATDIDNNGLMGILRNCPKIKSIAISAEPASSMSGMPIIQLMQSPMKDLKYLELHNFDFDDEIESLLPAITGRIPGLEFVFGGAYGSSVTVCRNNRKV